MNLPPDSFYYALSFLFGAGLLWIIRSYIVRTDSILRQLSDNSAEMKKMLAVHEQMHKEHDRRIDEVKGNKFDREMFEKINTTLELLTAERRK